jgi:UDP-glucose 4-epimerase
MKILVTGGAGFIGSHLIDTLIKKGHDVTSIDRGGLSYRNPSAKYIVGDLCNHEVAIKHIKNFDIVFHLAGNVSVVKSTEDPMFDFENNFLLTFNVLDAMRKNGIKKIVFTSTAAVYGKQKIFPIKEDIPFGELKPISNYAASKLSSEIYIHSFSNLYGIDGLVLRMANVVGPRSNHGIIPDLVRKVKNNPNRLEVFGDGNQRKSYMHVSDCMNAIIKASENFGGFDIFNIGYDEWIVVNEIVSLVCGEMNVDPEIVYTGGEGGWPGDVPEFILDASKIKNLGWKPKMKLKQAIIDAIKSNK